jgi:hypothetical protein
MPGPIICFGQQPCGFFPKRFLVAKIFTARKLQQEIGGEIVFFYHDADHDPRETRTLLHHRQTGAGQMLNFEFENKLQRKFSPLFLKRVPAEWHKHMANALGNYVDKQLVAMFREAGEGGAAGSVADFCLEMYRRLGLMEGVRVVRSGDGAFREAACAIEDFFVDVPHEGEIVRARAQREADGKLSLSLHEGGNAYIALPAVEGPIEKRQLSPTRDSRLKWMQSVIRCTHYVCGAGEQQYLRKEDAPEIEYVARETIERSDDAWTGEG